MERQTEKIYIVKHEFREDNLLIFHITLLRCSGDQKISIRILCSVISVEPYKK